MNALISPHRVSRRTILKGGALTVGFALACDGHVRAFAFFGGVPKSILYDNSKLAVVRILGRPAAADARVRRAAIALPVRGPVRPAWER